MGCDHPTAPIPGGNPPTSNIWLLSDAELHPAAVGIAPQPEARAVLLTIALTKAPRVLPGGSARLELLAGVDDALSIALALLQAAIDLKHGRARP